MFQKSEQADSPEQDLLEKLQGPRILGLPEPENRLFSDRRIAIGPRHLDQQRHALESFFATLIMAGAASGSLLTLRPKMAFSRTRSLGSWVTSRRSTS